MQERLQALLAALDLGGEEPGALAVDDLMCELDRAFAAADLQAQSGALVLAARAVDLKARRLLPAPDGDQDDAAAAAEDGEPWDLDGETPEALAERLAAFAVYRQAAEVLRGYEERRGLRFARPALAPPAPADPPPVPLSTLLEVFQAVWERARPETRALERERLTLLARMEALRARLRAAGGPLGFAELFSGGAGRIDVIVTFLALLELVRIGEAVLQQEAPGAPVLVRLGDAAPDPAGPAAARGADGGPGSAETAPERTR